MACVEKPANLYRVILLSVEHQRYYCRDDRDDDSVFCNGGGGDDLYDQDMEPRPTPSLTSFPTTLFPTTTPMPTLIVVTRNHKNRDRFASLAKDFVAGLRREKTTTMTMTAMTTTTTAITTPAVKDEWGKKDEEREEEELAITVMTAKEAYKRILGEDDDDKDRRGKGTGGVGGGADRRYTLIFTTTP